MPTCSSRDDSVPHEEWAPSQRRVTVKPGARPRCANGHSDVRQRERERGARGEEREHEAPVALLRVGDERRGVAERAWQARRERRREASRERGEGGER